MNLAPALQPTAHQTVAPGPRKAPAIKVVPKAEADRLTLSQPPAARLRQINEEAGGLLVRALETMARDPLRTAKCFLQQMFEPLYDPIGGLKRCWQAYQSDGWLNAAMNLSLYLSSAASTVAFLAMAAAVIAAPFTAGTSLAAMPFLSGVIIVSGFHDAGMTVALLAKDEYDAMHCTTEDELADKEGELADDFLDTFFAWATLPMSNLESALAVPPQGMLLAARPAAKAARSGARAAARVLGVNGAD